MVDEMLDHGLVIRLRRALVERDLVDAPLFLEISKQPDQRLANRAGSDDVNDVLIRHYESPRKKRADCSRVEGEDRFHHKDTKDTKKSSLCPLCLCGSKVFRQSRAPLIDQT